MTGRSDGTVKGRIRGTLFPGFLSRGDIHRRIAASMTLYAVCVILLIGAVSCTSVNLLIRKNLRLSMESSALQHAVKLGACLDSVQESLSHLSSNSLLINALIDTSEGRSYIDSFVKSHRAEGILVAEVPVGEMVDAHLTALGSNDTGFRMMSGARALLSRNFVEDRGFHQFDMPLSTKAPMKDLGLSMRIESHRRISLWWLIPAYAVSGGLLLVLSTILARRISFSLTSHLRALGTIAQRVAESGSLDRHADVTGEHRHVYL